ncbi:hypothetical protein [Actinoplanes missouriensis]|uniref:hypothetical protein n=1 Tax=Actinoplanes missouriensis TaxID=1866 RepID=UPI0002E53FC1|nr:hypothetical protein [Actinoplanes missouriensis]
MLRSPASPVNTAGNPTISPLAAWTTSIAATAASTYALDACAAAAGAVLVASGLLADLGHRSVVVFLLATYGPARRARLRCGPAVPGKI